MKTQKLLFFLVLVSLMSAATAQSQDSLWQRTYKLFIYNQYDLRNSSTNFITAHRVLNDAFRKNIKSKMGEKLGNISYGIFSFSTTYLAMLWSHEMGHALRAQQVDGYFKFHDAGLPIPYTTMHLPNDIVLQDEALSVTAGFEVNYLNVRSIQQEFISQNGIYNEDLGLSFANRLMYPLYTSVIVPIDTTDTSVWIETAGDPVHVALPVFKKYANGQVFMTDGSVNPKLVDYYNQAALFGAFFNLLDPQFYREAGETFGKDKVRRPIFIIGNHTTGWTYGTLFNVSPLGYELYMNNYLHVHGNQFAIYLKYGNPFKNNGLGIRWNNFIHKKNIQATVNLDLWDQDLYGTGLAADVAINRNLFGRWGTSVAVGYKTEGYVLGKQLNEGFNLGIGITYQAYY